MKRNSMLTKIIAVLLCALMVAAWLPKTSAAANDDFESGMDRIYGTDAKNAMPLVIGTNADSGLANAYYAYTPAEDGTLTLTEAGLETAHKIFERHTTLTSLLIRLGVDPETASEDACKMEHVISDETFDAFKRHIKQYG